MSGGKAGIWIRQTSRVKLGDRQQCKTKRQRQSRAYKDSCTFTHNVCLKIKAPTELDPQCMFPTHVH